MRRTGCRPGEAAGLRWRQVNLERGVVILPAHKTARTQRTPLPRIIYLDPVAVKLLRWLKQRASGDHVFMNYRSTPWDRHSLSHRVQRARQAAGLPPDVKLYGVRHAFGTRAITSGCDLKTLATILGHTTTKMTERYVHLAGKDGHLAAAMVRINRGAAEKPTAAAATSAKRTPPRR